MKLAFDLDGTLYDTFPKIFEVDISMIKELGYNMLTPEEYKSKYQTKDWNKFYRDLGVKEEHLEQVVNGFYERFKILDPPKLIPGAREIIQEAEKVLGNENIYIITNEDIVNVRRRFKKDGLSHYLDRIDCPIEGKSKELYRLATNNNGNLLFYIGDLVSDGQDCSEAREMGAKNLRFCGIVHPYSMNLKKDMIRFVNENKDFAQILNNIDEISSLWNLNSDLL